jgi:hypothetical protein
LAREAGEVLELYHKHRPNMRRRAADTPQWSVPSDTNRGKEYEWVEPESGACPCPARTKECWHVRVARMAESRFTGDNEAYMEEVRKRSAERKERRTFFSEEQIWANLGRMA